ncbi:MAG: SGNH/GDSL hydrolase family protein [Desulfobacteraceae bacterium]|nr:SGNH/GDSL hydrolase family protein [Desulfobacteraceae bacterium]
MPSSKKSILIVIAITFLFSELALRVFFAVRIGPSLFWYGTKWCNKGYGGWVELTANKQSPGGYQSSPLGYSKFLPNFPRSDHDPRTGELFPVRINASGFRGDDFAAATPPGILRIAVLGASSTFGYGDRDNETYPAILKSLLEAEAASPEGGGRIKGVEVFNLGIPHLTSEQILSLFIHEGLPLAPDIVTFYEGINDATHNFAELPEVDEESALRNLLRIPRNYSLIYAVFWEIAQARLTYPEAYFNRFIAGKSDVFLQNVSKIKDLCAQKGIKFFFVTQQARSMSIDPVGLTYLDEVKMVTEKLKNGKATRNDVYFLAHGRIIEAARKWCAENNVSMIDGIRSLDSSREHLWSWVHLTGPGNRILAEAIASEMRSALPHTNERSR